MITKRLFLAADLEENARSRVAKAIAELRDTARQARIKIAWVPAAHLHLTLKFLGPTDAGLIPEIARAMRESAERTAPFEVMVRGVGAFPSETAPRVLWVGAEDASGVLVRLAADLDRRAAALGFALEERAYRPHLTIGRVKAARDAGVLLAPFQRTEFGLSVVRDLVLYESTTLPVGAVYTKLERIALSGA